MDAEQVILVDYNDNEIGVMDKMLAHKEGKLHRAVSVIVCNSKKQLLLQKRASSKYHSPGLWSNTCCSHPRMNESTHETGIRRLMEEMGIQCSLTHSFNLTYKVQLDNNMIEHEFDYVYIGQTDSEPKPNPNEVSDWRYADIALIEQEMNTQPHFFTYWFKLMLQNHRNKLML